MYKCNCLRNIVNEKKPMLKEWPKQTKKRFGERPISKFTIKGYEIEAYSRKDAIVKLKHKGLL